MRHNILNMDIDRIFEEKLATWSLPRSDVIFFRRKKDNLKELRRRQKERWVEDANDIFSSYHEIGHNQTRNFIRHFEGTERRKVRTERAEGTED